MDFIQIKKLPIALFIGIEDWEKKHLQIVDITLKLKGNFHYENLQEGVDYSILCKQLIESFAHQKIDLIETLNQQIGQWALDIYPSIQKATVRTTKRVVVTGLPKKITLKTNHKR